MRNNIHQENNPDVMYFRDTKKKNMKHGEETKRFKMAPQA
jgi:hypothetical protein